MRRRRPRSVRTSSPVLRHVFRPGVNRLEARTLLSTITWASDVSGDWDNPSMWTGGAVPGAGDDAVIPFGDITVTHDSAVNDTVDSIDCQSALDLAAGSLIIDTTSPSQPISTISGQFNLGGDSLQLLAGSLSFTGGGTVSGTISGAEGTTLIFGGSSFTFGADSILSTAGSVALYSTEVTESGAYDVTTSTMVGGGTVTFSAPIADVGNDLTNGGTIDLPGQSFSLSTLENSGTINGGGGASLTVTSSMSWGGGTITGFGLLAIADGSSLSITGDPGSVLALDGVVLDNAGTATISLAGGCCGFELALEDGAGIDNEATGSFSFSSEFTYTTQVLITSDGSATYFENEGSLVQGNLAAPGYPMIIEPAFTQTSSGTTSVLTGQMMFTGGGTVSGTISGAEGTTLIFGGSSFTFGADSILSTAGSVALYSTEVTESGAYDVTTSTMVGGGTVTFSAPIADVGNDLTNGGTIDLPGQSFSLSTLENSGTINGGGGASLTVTSSMSWGGGTITGFGLLAIADGSSLSITGDPGSVLALDGVVLDNAGTATISLAGGCCGFELALEDGAGIDNEATGSFSFSSEFTYTTQVLITSDGSATYFENEGSLVQGNLAAPGYPMIIEPAFTQTSSGTTSVLTGSLALESTATNSGTITIAPGTTLSVNSYTQTAGSTVLDGGTINGGILSINGGALTGSGTINANITNASHVIPGDSGTAGTLTINGNYTQSTNGSLNIAVGGTTAGSQYDQLDVNGTATLGGTLGITLIDGFTPTLGQTFTVVTSSPLSSTFGTINQSLITGPVTFQPTYSSSSVVLVAEESSTTSLVSSANPSAYGQSVTFTATVKPTSPNKGTPTGTVNFFDGATSLGTATLSAAGKATLKTAGLAIGTDPISVVYSGDTNFATSGSATLPQVVTSDSTTSSLTASANPSVFGQSVTLTATVSVVAPGAGTPTGSFTFLDGSTVLATVALSGRTATFKTSSLAVGSHAITAAYSGDSNYATSTSAILAETVNLDATTTSLASSKNPSVFGQSVTFTTTVKAASPGSGTPTGSVIFLDGSTVLATVNLSGGTATYSTTTLAVAAHTITVSYSGDGNFLASGSTALTQTVNPDATTTKATSSANPSVFGQSVTFTATVAVSSPGIGTPTGTVTFLDGSTVIGTAVLSGISGNDQATFTTTGLAIGAHTIKASYGGDTNSVASPSSALTQTVKAASTTVSLASSANPSVVGQSVTFSATVSIVSPGSGTLTGTVSFYSGFTLLGTESVNSTGLASYTTSSLAVGTYSIKAVYGNDPDFNTSTSAVLRQVVQKASSSAVVVTTRGSVIDQVLGVIQDESTDGTLVHDIAAEQVWSAKNRAGAKRFS